MPELIINGEAKSFEKELTVAEFVDSLDLKGRKVAVEVNLEVIRKGDWETTTLSDNDRIEVVHFVGGG